MRKSKKEEIVYNPESLKLRGNLKACKELREQLGLNVDEVQGLSGLGKKELSKIWKDLRPSVEKAGKKFGTIVVFGTGGSIGNNED